MKRYAVTDTTSTFNYGSYRVWQVLDREEDVVIDEFDTRAEARAEIRRLEASEQIEGDLLVYRVAHPTICCARTGVPKGPYMGSSDWANYLVPYKASPTPCSDGLVDIEADEVCGFSSMEAFFAWFGRAIFSLDAAGYTLHVYRVPASAVRHGRRQVVYRYEEAVLERQERLEEIARAAGAEMIYG